MNPTCNKILRDYDEGRTTPTGFFIDFLNAANRDDLDEALDVLPPDLIQRLRAFVATYHADTRVFRGLPLLPKALTLAKDVLAKHVKSA
jgi:hypothetical protein